jgi:hypothetical protein
MSQAGDSGSLDRPSNAMLPSTAWCQASVSFGTRRKLQCNVAYMAQVRAAWKLIAKCGGATTFKRAYNTRPRCRNSSRIHRVIAGRYKLQAAVPILWLKSQIGVFCYVFRCVFAVIAEIWRYYKKGVDNGNDSGPLSGKSHSPRGTLIDRKVRNFTSSTRRGP